MKNEPTKSSGIPVIIIILVLVGVVVAAWFFYNSSRGGRQQGRFPDAGNIAEGGRYGEPERTAGSDAAEHARLADRVRDS